MTLNAKCDLIHDEHGWWLQYTDKNGKVHVTLMDAESERDAQLEAYEEGYLPVGVIYV